ncbi:hypothetical protein FSO04_42830 [Paraburkholderia madseniana]|uniref:Uncharacterized protein n=1 Tax=Paraburkholderia madseniana TaxID=2599607 RepID=A0A6N6VZN9_9BURK|nr:hypothetical protein [Paraburkholderia madseniana]KAE8753855.1 hypothetical protein FSO04_42830 [Paraburkholderia madseniana]
MTQAEAWEFFKQFVLTGGGAAAIAYGLFKWLGQKWIEDKFSQRLEHLRQTNAKELAELKVKWDTDLQGKLKYQEREFTVIPDAWEKLSDAFGLVSWLTSRSQQYADVEAMNDPELEQFLKDSELLETQKQQLRQRTGRDRAEFYQHTIFFHRYQRTETAVRQFSVYANRNFLFMPDTLFVKLGTLSDHLYSALTTVRIGHESHHGPMIGEAAEITAAKIRPLVDEVQSDIRQLMIAHRREQEQPRTPPQGRN